MAPLRTYMLPAFAAVAAVRAAKIEDFMPGCAPACINEAISTHSTCEKGDGQCLCADIYSLKRHAEDCLEESCSDAEYGEAMLGYDEFCAAVEDGPSDPPPSTTAVPPPEPTETSAPPPPPETTASEEPEPTTTVSVPEEPSEEPTMPTIEPTDSHTSISVPAPTHSGTETFPSVTPVPMPTVSVPTNGTSIPEPTESGEPGEPEPTESGGDGDQPPTDPSATETPPPADAGANFGVSFGVLAGGALLATFFGF